MYPTYPSSNDPNAAYRNAIAAFSDNHTYIQNEQPNNEPHTELGLNQANMVAELNPRRMTNRDRLNAIARNIGPNLGIAAYMIENGNSNTSETTEVATSSSSTATIATVRQYLGEKGYINGSDVPDETIQNRLESVNVSVQTLLIALEAAQDVNYPLLAHLGPNSLERFELISRLAGIINIPHILPHQFKAVLRSANDDPDQIITQLLHYISH